MELFLLVLIFVGLAGTISLFLPKGDEPTRLSPSPNRIIRRIRG